MSVKLGTFLSNPKRVTGGAVQGSVLGVLDRNVVLNDLDEDLPDIYSAKYVDDLTLIDTVEVEVQCMIDQTPKKTLHTFSPPNTVSSFEKIKQKANSKGLKINEKKTQILSVSSVWYDTEALIKMGDQTITSGEELKMLGFYFSPQPTVKLQIEKLVKKANKRFFLLLKYKRAGVRKERLRDIYTSIIRSCLEYSSPVYHCQLNGYLNNLLERVQKKCLRTIYRYSMEYEELLGASNLSRLEQRRVIAFQKFTNKTVKNTKYANWFPKREIIKETRNTSIYLEELAVGDRLYNSPLFAMRHYLNNTESHRQTSDLIGIFNTP